MKTQIVALVLAAVTTLASNTPLSQYILRHGDTTYIHSQEPEIDHPDSGDYFIVVYNDKQYQIRDQATIERALTILESTREVREAKREAKRAARELRRAERHAKDDAERARLASERAVRQAAVERASADVNAAKERVNRELTALVEQAIRSGLAK
jgi:hypothetical protein